MSTLFIAVQCFQCSTMQVKQQRKSSNKWTCVVCNERQSVRRVFARSHLAKDLRKFVQSFNMSRKLSDQQQQQEEQSHDLLLTPTPSQIDVVRGNFNDDQNWRKSRTDWSEYLDPEEKDYRKQNIKKQENEGDDFGTKIVTELPKEMFKKPKLTGDYALESGYGPCNLYKPVFSKRNANKIGMSQDKEMRKQQPTEVISASKWINYMTQDNKDSRTSLPTIATATKISKWNDYITQDGDELKLGSAGNFEDDTDQWSHGAWKTILDDQKVEDDIHPDFM